MTIVTQCVLYSYVVEVCSDTRPLQKRRKKQDLPPPIKEKMKKALNEAHKAVVNCEDETGRRRSDLFRELPDRKVRFPFPHNVRSTDPVA